MSIFCSHSYQIVFNMVMPSEFDMLISSGLKPNTHTSFKRQVKCILKCDKCSKIKTIKL